MAELWKVLSEDIMSGDVDVVAVFDDETCSRRLVRELNQDCDPKRVIYWSERWYTSSIVSNDALWRSKDPFPFREAPPE